MKKTLLVIFAILATAQLYAQQNKLSGTITDTLSSQPLNGASVTIAGKVAGTTTDSRTLTFWLTVSTNTFLGA